MYAPRPIITLLDTPAEILSLELVKEFIGLDPDLDATQDRALPVLIQSVIEDGEQITGIVWAAASYRIDGLCSLCPDAGFRLPLAPVFSVTDAVGKDCSGMDIPIESYSLIPSAIDMGRPWAVLEPLPGWPGEALQLSITCTAGWGADNIPAGLRAWALNRIATLYDYREDLVTGTITASLPRHHARGMLDRWTVRGTPDG